MTPAEQSWTDAFEDVVRTRYVWGPGAGSAPVYRVVGTTPEKYHPDGLGSVRFTDPSGLVIVVQPPAGRGGEALRRVEHGLGSTGPQRQRNGPPLHLTT